MRLLLVAALAVTALAARDTLRWNSEVVEESLNRADSFERGFEYRFHLDSQVSNGLSIPGSEQAALRTQSLVALSFPESTIGHLRIDKIRFASLQKPVEEPKKMQPFDLFEDVEIKEEHLHKLRLPLRFRYEDGLVSEIEFDREDAEWSKNIKKSYLNMLQVNLAQKNVTEESPRLYSGKDAVFNAHEMTLEGDCEVTYTVLPEQSEKYEHQSELRVTKSLNFNKCAHRVGQKAFRHENNWEKREEKREEAREIESSTVFDYKIQGSASRFLIREVELRSVYVYAPLTKEDSLFTTFVTGKLRLVEIIKEDKRIAGPKSEKKETLLHSLEWEKTLNKFMGNGDDSLLEIIQESYTVLKNKPEIVARLVRALVFEMKSAERGIELAATHEMGKIVTVLRICTKEEIKRMHKEICESRDSQMKEVFLDALALAGSLNTIEHLVEKIREREVSPLRASHLLKQLSSVPAPSKEIVRTLVSLCKDSRRQPLERQACWLTVGAVMNGVCGGHSDLLESERICPRDVKENFVRELVDQFKQATTRYEKTLALKTIANSGMDLIVFPLEKIIRDEKEDKAVRVEAIEALRKLRAVLPRKLVSVLLPVFKSRSEHPEMRVAAFHQIMQTLPEKTVVDQIANHLEFEPSTQVYSFVYSAFTHIAQSPLPSEKPLADSCKSALKSLRAKPTRALSSTYKQYSAYHEKSQSGATFNMAALFGADSALPKELKATHEAVIAGKMNKHLAHLGFKQHNIEKKLRKLLAKVERSGLEEVIVRGKRSVALKPAEILRELFSSLSITPREESNENAHADFYVRVNDMDYALLPIDDDVVYEMLKGVVRNGKIDMTSLENVLEKGLRFNSVVSTIAYTYSTTIVHSMGMPLVYSASLPAILKVEGEVKVELESTTMISYITARPTLAATHVTKVEILSPLINLGVKLLHSVQANLPVEAKVEMRWKDRLSVETTFALPKDNVRLAQLSTRPVTYVRAWPKETRAYVQPKEKTIYVEELESLVHKIDESYLEKATGGIKVNVEGHLHGHIWEKGVEGVPSALLVGENNVVVSFEKTSKTPKECRVKFEVDLFVQKHMQKDHKMTRFLGADVSPWAAEEWQTEKDSEEDEDRRRAAFRSYFETYESGKAYAHRLSFMVETASARPLNDKRAELSLKTVCDEKMRYCQFEINARRSPIHENESDDWQFKSEIDMLYPEMPESLAHLSKMKHRELSVNVETLWGSNEKNQMTINIQGEQNKEQKKWLKLVSESRNEEWTPMEEYYRLLEASILNQFRAVVTYDINSTISQGHINRFYTMLKAQAPIFSSSIENGHNQKNTVRAQLTLEPLNGKYANISIETPSEKVIIRDLHLGSSLPRLNIRRQPATPLRSLSSLRSALVEETQAKCTVESRKVNTFDDVIFRAPLTTCYSVLAKDCSSEKPEFAVLMKKISKSGEEKKIKIIARDYVIEMEMDKKTDKMRVIIDGEEIERPERLEKARIYKNVQVVMFDHDEFSVEFDGYTAIVKLSEYYKNKQCGICGHFDGEKNTEFRRADNEETEDLEEFHRSFLVKDGECKVEEDKLSEKRNYRVESEESEESIFETKWEKKSSKHGDDYDSEIEPVKRTRVVEESKKVCFSMEPLPECPKKTTKEGEKKMNVAFTCLDRSNSETVRLVRESRREVLDLSDFPESFTETVTVPRSCLAY